MTGVTTFVQSFPVGQGHEGPQQDMAGREGAAEHEIDTDGAAMSEAAIKTWQSTISHLFTK